MSDLIRIGAGTVSPSTLLGTSSYLVTNWPRQTDMAASDYWAATQPEAGEFKQEFRAGLEVGSSKWVGLVSGIIEFFILTEDMRQYIDSTIMSNQPIAPATVYAHHAINGFQVYTGELVTPYAANADASYSRFSDAYYTNNQYLFRRGSQVSDYLLLESNDFILLESGDKILLE